MTARTIRNLGAAAILAFAGLTSGCVATVPHQPDQTLVTELGQEEAGVRLAEVLTRARQPYVAEVDVDADSFAWGGSVGISVHYGWGWHGVGHAGHVEWARRIYWASIARVDVYENGRVFLLDAGGRSLQRFTFHSVPDALLFSDLIASFQAVRRRPTSTPRS